MALIIIQELLSAMIFQRILLFYIKDCKSTFSAQDIQEKNILKHQRSRKHSCSLYLHEAFAYNVNHLVLTIVIFAFLEVL
jgi:hypothetical protein